MDPYFKSIKFIGLTLIPEPIKTQVKGFGKEGKKGDSKNHSVIEKETEIIPQHIVGYEKDDDYMKDGKKMETVKIQMLGGWEYHALIKKEELSKLIRDFYNGTGTKK